MSDQNKTSRLIGAIKAAEANGAKIDFAGKTPHSINTQEQARLTL